MPNAKNFPCKKPRRKTRTSLSYLNFQSLCKVPAICNLRVNQPAVFLLFASPTESDRKGLFTCDCSAAREIETLFEKLLVTDFLCIASRRRKGAATHPPRGLCARLCAPGPQVTCAFCYYAPRTRRVYSEC